MTAHDADAEALPKRPMVLALLISTAATMTLAWPLLLGRFLVSPDSDQYLAGYAFRDFAASSLRAGHGVPQWNPYLFGGMPYVAAMHGDIFYPTALLRLWLPTDIAMSLGFVLHMILAGIFTVGFLRASGVRYQSAMVGGMTYLLGGVVASYASPGHDGKLFVSALLPAALWLLVRGLRDGQLSAWGGLALVVGLAALSPHPQLLQYLLLTSGSFALFVILRPRAIALPVHAHKLGEDRAAFASGPPPRFPRAVAARRLALAALAVALGGAIAAVQYVPVVEYTPWSPRTGGKGWEHAISYSFPLEETINVYLPQFSGLLERYWGRNGMHLHSEYLGASVLVLALFALGGGLLNRHLKHAWFWLGTLIVALFWAWGGNTPFFGLVYAVVPGTRFFRAPSMTLYVVSFATAVLAAFGAERVLARRLSYRYGLLWLGFAAMICAMGTTGALTDVAARIAENIDAGRGALAGGQSSRVFANAPALALGAWRSGAFVLLTVALMLLVGRRKLPVSTGGWLLVGVVCLDLWTVSRHYWRFSPPAKELYASDEITSFLTSQTQPVRVITLSLSDNSAFHDPFLTGDALMTHNIRTTLGYHGNELGRYQQLYGLNNLAPLANPNFWALTNSQFLYTDVNTPPLQGTRLVAGPARNAAGSMTYLYELPGSHPLAWVTPKFVRLPDPTTRATILNPLVDVRRVAIFDSASSVAAAPIEGPLPEPVSATVRSSSYGPGTIDLVIDGDVPKGSAMVVSENFYPGWTATVDGKEAHVERADLSLMGIELPEGARTVSLRFISTTYQSGRIITFCALAATLLLLVGGLLLDRRRTSSSAA